MSQEAKPTRTYTKGNLQVLWFPERCIHSEDCWNSLPKVFDPSQRPWVKLENGTDEEIIKVCENCPSNALVAKVTPCNP